MAVAQNQEIVPPCELPAWVAAPSDEGLGGAEIWRVPAHATGRQPEAVSLVGRAWLLLGRRHLNKQERQPDVELTTPRASRKQALLLRNWHGQVFLMDLGSSHGTYLVGKKLTPNSPTEWRPGMVAHFADKATEVFERRPSGLARQPVLCQLPRSILIPAASQAPPASASASVLATPKAKPSLRGITALAAGGLPASAAIKALQGLQRTADEGSPAVASAAPAPLGAAAAAEGAADALEADPEPAPARLSSLYLSLPKEVQPSPSSAAAQPRPSAGAQQPAPVEERRQPPPKVQGPQPCEPSAASGGPGQSRAAPAAQAKPVAFPAPRPRSPSPLPASALGLQTPPGDGQRSSSSSSCGRGTPTEIASAAAASPREEPKSPSRERSASLVVLRRQPPTRPLGKETAAKEEAPQRQEASLQEKQPPPREETPPPKEEKPPKEKPRKEERPAKEEKPPKEKPPPREKDPKEEKAPKEAPKEKKAPPKEERSESEGWRKRGYSVSSRRKGRRKARTKSRSPSRRQKRRRSSGQKRTTERERRARRSLSQRGKRRRRSESSGRKEAKGDGTDAVVEKYATMGEEELLKLGPMRLVECFKLLISKRRLEAPEFKFERLRDAYSEALGQLLDKPR